MKTGSLKVGELSGAVTGRALLLEGAPVPTAHTALCLVGGQWEVSAPGPAPGPCRGVLGSGAPSPGRPPHTCAVCRDAVGTAAPGMHRQRGPCGAPGGAADLGQGRPRGACPDSSVSRSAPGASNAPQWAGAGSLCSGGNGRGRQTDREVRGLCVLSSQPPCPR